MNRVMLAVVLGLVGCSGRGPAPAGPDLVVASVERLRAEVTRPGARATVLNVWATWCGPCREEFPDLLELERKYRDQGLRLILVSADFEDQAEEARRFLAGHEVSFASYLKTGDDMEFIEGLHPRWSGALPATFVYDGSGALRHFQEGRIRFEALESRVLEAFQAQDSIPKETLP